MNNDDIMPDYQRIAEEKLKALIEIKSTKEEKKLAPATIMVKAVCTNCRREILQEEAYYRCSIHKKIFCENCIKNYGKSEIPFTESIHCISGNFVETDKWKECIYQRIEPEEDKEQK